MVKIITITGVSGSGKTTALNDLAKLYEAKVIYSEDFKLLLPALKAKVIALAPNTFIDEVYPDLVKQVEKVLAEYPSNYRVYLAMHA